jgi:hypothetical protein
MMWNNADAGSRMNNRNTKVIFRLHALKRMVERKISPEDVFRILKTGVDIERYLEDHPYPSRLVLGTIGPDRCILL